MFTLWLVTILAIAVAALLLGEFARHDRPRCAPRSHRRDPLFRSPKTW